MESWSDLQRMEDGLPPAPLVFDGAWMQENFGPFGPDEADFESMNLAMDRDTRDREAWYSERLEFANAEIAELRERLDELEG